MERERLKVTDLIFELFSSLPRCGPGSPETTLRALAGLGALPGGPVLDLGCGTGAQSLVLAGAGLEPVAVDISPFVLSRLAARAAGQGLAARVRPVAADMAALPFRPGTFGLIWCEAAIYNLGFENGLAALSRYLAPGGLMVVSEVVWLTDAPSPENREFWASEYPGMLGLEQARLAVGRAGLEPLSGFMLPDSDWDLFYAHLERALPEFIARHPGEPDALELAGLCRKEIAVRRAYGAEYGFAFFLLRRAA